MFWETLHSARILADAAGGRSPISVATLEGLGTPTRVPQGVMSATAYFQDVMTELLAGSNCKVWVHVIVWWGVHKDDLLKTVDKVLVRLEDAGLFAAAHKFLFFDTEISWYGKVYTGGKGISRPGAFKRIGEHVPSADDGCADAVFAGRKLVGGRFFLGWQRWSSPFECCWRSTWGKFHAGPSERRFVAPKGKYMRCCMFPDASDSRWRRFLTQVSTTELEDGAKVVK